MQIYLNEMLGHYTRSFQDNLVFVTHTRYRRKRQPELALEFKQFCQEKTSLRGGHIRNCKTVAFAHPRMARQGEVIPRKGSERRTVHTNEPH